MNFVNSIAAGANMRYVVQEYAISIIDGAGSESNWLHKMGHHFVGQCFQAVGLNFNVTLEDFSSQSHNVASYIDDNLHYVFNSRSHLLEHVNMFFKQMPHCLSDDGHGEGMESGRAIGPLFYYLNLVKMWSWVAQKIVQELRCPHNSTVSHICEPVGRLSLGILRGLVKVLPNNPRNQYLQDVCVKLAALSGYSILFERNFRYTLTPLIRMFEKHYEVFGEHAVLPIIRNALRCEISRNILIDIYAFLVRMLDKFAVEQQSTSNNELYLRMYTNRLVQDDFLVIQFETLRQSRVSSVQLATLRYLNTLQIYVASAEVFPTRLLEQILLLLVRNNTAQPVRSAAAELYITMAKRQKNEIGILVHILETFVKAQQNFHRNGTYEQAIKLLQNYLKDLIQFLPSVGQFDYYMSVVVAMDVPIELSMFAAHAIYALFSLREAEDPESEHAIRLLTYFTKMIDINDSRKKIRAILYGIYSVADFKKLAPGNPSLLSELEQFGMVKFLYDDTLSEVECSSLFNSICASIQATGNEQSLVTVAQLLQQQYANLALALLGGSSEQNLESFALCVRRAWIMLKMNKLRGHQVCHMYEPLVMQLLNGATDPHNECLAVCGYECLAYMLVLLFRERDQLVDFEEHSVKVMQFAKQLRDFCVGKLAKVDNAFPLVKGKFCSIIVIQLVLHEVLPLTEKTYNVLLLQLTNPTIVDKIRVNCLDHIYFREMHLLFHQLHDSKIKIPWHNNGIWKILTQFKMDTSKPDYTSPLLANLIRVLIKKRIEIYANSLPIIFSCMRMSSKHPQKLIVKALLCHLDLINECASEKDAWLLKYHTFMRILQIVDKKVFLATCFKPVEHTGNPFSALFHIMDWVSMLLLKRHHFVSISRILFSLKNRVTSTNKHILESVIDEISGHKACCDTEFNGVLSLYELMPEPLGPLNHWQAKIASTL